MRTRMAEWPNGGMKFPKADIRSPMDFEQMAKLVRPEDFEGRMLISSDLEAHRKEIQKFADMGFDRSTCTTSGAIRRSGSRPSAARSCPRSPPRCERRRAGRGIRWRAHGARLRAARRDGRADASSSTPATTSSSTACTSRPTWTRSCTRWPGLANDATGWGVRDETWSRAEMLERYGAPTWFRLGDRDLATHLVRTRRCATARA